MDFVPHSGQPPAGEDDSILKFVVVGDPAVGKTCMLISYTTNRFPAEYTPTVFDNYTSKIDVDGKTWNLHLWDTAGSEHFDMLRPLTYMGAKVFMLCFAIGDRRSFKNIQTKWLPDLRKKVPKAQYILVGTKADLRDLGEASELVSKEEGEAMSQKLGAKMYCECSSVTQAGLKEVFQNAIIMSISEPQEEESGGGGGCCILM